jgi:tetratricopeptide (TPR) repeat protein
LWSETFDRELTDVFAVQDEIANAVVDALKLKLLPDQALVNHARSANAEAYNEFLLGRQLNNQQNPEGWTKAIAAFERAIKLDPQYAAAYAGLSQAGSQLADHNGDNIGKQKALENANRAVALAPDLADGYFARAMALLTFTQDWAGAQADLEEALALNDSDSLVLLGYARFLCSQARLPEAVATARRATERDPLQTLAWAIYGRVLAANGEYQESRNAMERAVELSPTSAFALFHLGNAHLLAGRPAEALPIFQRTAAAYGLVGVAMSEYSLGHEQESQAALDAAIAKSALGAAYQIAEAYAWRGESDKAFEWLDRAVAQNDGGVGFIRADPLLANVIDDPRFAALLKRMGLVD